MQNADRVPHTQFINSYVCLYFRQYYPATGENATPHLIHINTATHSMDSYKLTTHQLCHSLFRQLQQTLQGSERAKGSQEDQAFTSTLSQNGCEVPKVHVFPSHSTPYPPLYGSG